MREIIANLLWLGHAGDVHDAARLLHFRWGSRR